MKLYFWQSSSISVTLRGFLWVSFKWSHPPSKMSETTIICEYLELFLFLPYCMLFQLHCFPISGHSKMSHHACWWNKIFTKLKKKIFCTEARCKRRKARFTSNTMYIYINPSEKQHIMNLTFYILQPNTDTK